MIRQKKESNAVKAYRAFPSLLKMLARRKGASGTEYGLLVGLIGVTLLMALSSMGGSIDTVMCRITAAMVNVSGGVSAGCDDPNSTGNHAPTIAAVTDQTILQGAYLGNLVITLSDADAGDTLSLSAASSNTTLLPNANITLAGSGTSWTLSATPVAAQSGTSTITLTAGDGTTTTTRTFVLTVQGVNHAPSLAAIADQTIRMGAVLSALSVTLSDQDAGDTLTLSATSSNITLLPDASIVLAGSGTARTLTATPVASQYGTSNITLTVSDGTATATQTFKLTVTQNHAPTITAITDRTISMASSVSGLAVTLADADTFDTLTLTASSSNTALLPDASIVLSGTGKSRTLTATPVSTQYGSATVTLTVSDGILTGTQTFKVIVKNKIVFTSTGADQTFTVPAGVTQLQVKLWGAGGGSGGEKRYGGAGGYAAGIITVEPNQVLTIVVGKGGKGICYGDCGAAKYTTIVYGGGGRTCEGNTGGGLTGVFNQLSGAFSGSATDQGRALVIAGGGGGGGGGTTNTYTGGYGGGSSGGSSASGGGGGTQGPNGEGSSASSPGYTTPTTLNAAYMVGGSTAAEGQTDSCGVGNAFGGSGGGGYYGGGHGGRIGSWLHSSGGGGSGYTGGATSGANMSFSSGRTAPNSTDTDYAAGVGAAGTATAATSSGGDGLAVLCFPTCQ